MAAALLGEILRESESSIAADWGDKRVLSARAEKSCWHTRFSAQQSHLLVLFAPPEAKY